MSTFPKRHIVCAIDDSPGALAAAQWTARRWMGPDDAITLLHVMRMTVDDGIHDRYAAFAAHADQLLERVAATLSPLQVTRAAVVGVPAKAISQYATEHAATLVVLGHPAHGGVRGAFGSVVYSVLHSVATPVLVGPPTITPPTSASLRILVAVDGSPSATAAAIWCNQWAADHPATVGLVTVMSDLTEYVGHIPGSSTPEWMPSVWGATNWYWMPSAITDVPWDAVQAEAEKQAAEIIDKTRTLMPDCAIEAATITAGQPAAAILQEARHFGADLIIMGRRGHSTLGNLLGSVSFAVLQHTPIPVVVVGDQTMAARTDNAEHPNPNL
jgi:nucleotide-binding universal stress UspA family protein